MKRAFPFNIEPDFSDLQNHVQRLLFEPYLIFLIWYRVINFYINKKCTILMY